VIAGSARGRPLRTLPGLEVRPTLDRVRQGVFSSLGERVSGAVFLDLFAGSGAVGIEALSRGAERATFVESAAGCARRLQENLRRCGVEDRARLLQCDWRAGIERLRRGGEAFDLIYADPPYERFDEAAIVAAAAELLHAEGLLLLEHPRRRRVPEAAGGLKRVRAMEYGQTAVSVYRVDSPATSP
jgi:16S rRNA (guanine(966)-N(2))-methyltransferase RsmD